MIEQHTGWFKSSYSSGQTDCVEVRRGAGSMSVRDTKNRTGGTLAFDRTAWAAFVTEVSTPER